MIGSTPPDPKQASHARLLHEQSIVILAHDHLCSLDDVEAMLRGGVTAKTVKLTVDGLDWDEHGRRIEVTGYEGYTRRALMAMDRVYRLSEEHPKKVAIVRSADDILAAKRDGKVGLILGLEGPRPIEGSVEVLRAFHRLGLREMQLAWASPNQLITDGVLNGLGVEVVREMNRLGILVDLSHLSDAAFYQVLGLSEQPVIVSHTACAAVSGPGDRMSDEKIRALASKGGVAALHFVSGDYITARHGMDQAVLDDLIDHADHIRSLVGIEHVALGGDYFPTATGDTWAWVKQVERIDLMANVALGLVRRGYSDNEIRMVLGVNLLRLYQGVWRR